ncbi:MAG: peptide deformylase [Holosporales bacterium]
MAVRPVVKMGHPVLRRPAEPVVDFHSHDLKVLIHDLWDTLEQQAGVGLAAPQIGVSLRVLVARITARQLGQSGRPLLDPMVIINPTITPLSEEQVENWEACVSLPVLQGLVPRYRSIRVDYQDISGKPCQLEAHDFIARLFQHECDHLEGILYPQRMRNVRSLIYRSEFRDESQ